MQIKFSQAKDGLIIKIPDALIPGGLEILFNVDPELSQSLCKVISANDTLGLDAQKFARPTPETLAIKMNGEIMRREDIFIVALWVILLVSGILIILNLGSIIQAVGEISAAIISEGKLGTLVTKSTNQTLHP